MAPRHCLAALALLLAGCERKRVEEVPATVAAPAPRDRGELCADVADVRACWGAELSGADCERGVCLVERSAVGSHRSVDGWRCDGMGPERSCAPRSLGEATWQCDERTCVQRHPRLPDQGEWDCAELDGVVRCVGGHPAAGVPEGRPEPGWLCGARTGEPQARVCIDLAPDVPEPSERDRWRCKFLRREGLARSCERAPSNTTPLGSLCGEGRGCPDGAVCAGGRCLPPRPEPSCYLDDDCGTRGPCRFGTCKGQPPRGGG